ncbi:MAG: ATP synthase subunit I [Deltaproteobacteria bacterium]|nr:ATP synthase subunit I [Deltaproteobacteria bacterium]
MNEASKKFTGRVEKTNLAMSALLLAASLIIQDNAVILGIICGAVLSALNFRVLSLVVGKITEGSRGKVFYFALFGLKFLVLITVIYPLIAYLPLNVISFVISLSTIFVSIVLVSLLFGATQAA